MAAFSRGLRLLIPKLDFVCSRCLQFSTTTAAPSGHSRWSKIKHDKGAVDKKRATFRTNLTKDIATCSRLGGPDPKINPRLATILVTAKKASLPAAVIASAIARGQGKTTTGASLEPLTLEVIMPPNISVIIEAETDNKPRAMQDLRTLIKKRSGNVTPVQYLFRKRGRLAFEPMEGLGVDEVLDEAIEAGAEDVEDDGDGGLIVWTAPEELTNAAETLEAKMGLKVLSTDILWDPNQDTMVELDEKDGKEHERYGDMLKELQDYPGINGIYANIRQGNVADEVWESIQENLDS